MGRTALYRDPVPFRPARAEVHLEADALMLVMPDGRMRRYNLDGVHATTTDGFVAERSARGSSELIPRDSTVNAAPRMLRRFVRMLVLERDDKPFANIISPPEQGAVAPGVVRVPEAPVDAAIVENHVWDALADWLLGGGRLASCAVADLARLATIATPQFAVVIGEIAAQRALELVWLDAANPHRGGFDLDSVLQPLVDAAKASARAGEALVSALSHAAGARRRRRGR